MKEKVVQYIIKKALKSKGMMPETKEALMARPRATKEMLCKQLLEVYWVEEGTSPEDVPGLSEEALDELTLFLMEKAGLTKI